MSRYETMDWVDMYAEVAFGGERDPERGVALARTLSALLYLDEVAATARAIEKELADEGLDVDRVWEAAEADADMLAGALVDAAAGVAVGAARAEHWLQRAAQEWVSREAG